MVYGFSERSATRRLHDDTAHGHACLLCREIAAGHIAAPRLARDLVRKRRARRWQQRFASLKRWLRPF